MGAGGQPREDLLRGALATVSAAGLVGGVLVLAGGALDLLDWGDLVDLVQAGRVRASTIAVLAWSAMRAAGATTERTASVMAELAPHRMNGAGM